MRIAQSLFKSSDTCRAKRLFAPTARVASKTRRVSSFNSCPVSMGIHRSLYGSKADSYLSKVSVDWVEADQAYVLSQQGFPLKIANKAHIRSPSRAIAELIKLEWISKVKDQKQTEIPLTAMLTRALEIESNTDAREAIIEQTLKYLDTDSICYFDPSPVIQERQRQIWLPILDFISSRLGFPIKTTDSLNVVPQTDELHGAISSLLREQNSLCLVGLECLSRNFKSCLLAVGHLLGCVKIEDSIVASQLETALQVEKWGNIADFHDLQISRLCMEAQMGLLLLTASKIR